MDDISIIDKLVHERGDLIHRDAWDTIRAAPAERADSPATPTQQAQAAIALHTVNRTIREHVCDTFSRQMAEHIIHELRSATAS